MLRDNDRKDRFNDRRLENLTINTYSLRDNDAGRYGEPTEMKDHMIDIQPLTNEDAYNIFKASNALLEGHFLLASGLHSATYLEKFQVLQYPRSVERLCADMARRFRDRNIEVVLGPTTGGVLLAYEVAKSLGTRGIFAERGENDKGRVLRRGFSIAPGERVLLVDDILTTGGSVRETMEVVTEFGGNLAGIAVLADRTNGAIDFGVPLESLLKLDVVQYRPDECPLCANGIALTKRGSTPKPQENLK